ncbi:MAG: hypothetical protein RLZZ558_836 [Planctomycetota bacterium]
MGGETLLLLAWIGGAVFAAAMLWTLWWALFADRSRGVRRCPGCWHQMDVSVGMRCPECGRQTARERELLATRRRWPLAAACVLALLLGTVWLRVTIAQRGWWTLVTDRALIAILPWLPEGRDAAEVRSHLRDRLLQGATTPENGARILGIVERGDASAPPGSDAWRSSYGVLLDALRMRWSDPATPPDDPLRVAAAGLRPLIRIEAPDRWWPRRPLVLMARVESWWPRSVDVSLRLTGVSGLDLQPTARDLLQRTRWSRQEAGSSRQRWGVFPVELGPLPPGEHRGTLDFEWTLQDTLRPGASSRGVVRVPVHVKVPEGDAPGLAAVDTPELEQVLERVFEPGLLLMQSDPPRFAFSYRPFETSSGELDHVAFGLVVQACQDGVPRRTLRVWWRGGSARSLSGWEPPEEDLERLVQADEAGSWTLRVRGDPELALRAAAGLGDVDATHAWTGSIERALRVQRSPGDAASQPWRTERAAPTDQASSPR